MRTESAPIALNNAEREPIVFVVDGDPASQNAVRDVVSTMNLPCEVYGSGQEFLAGHDLSRIGCVILEVRVPCINGLEIQRRLAERGSLLSVIFLSERPDVSIVVEAMRSGAIHFLEKPCRAHELWKAIQEALEIGRRRREIARRRQELQSRVALLTSRERQVMELLEAGKSNREIAAELNLGIRTVELHRASLAKKFRGSSWPGLLEVVRTG